MSAAAFFFIALIVVGSALGLVLKRNPVHGALFLVVNLGAIAALYLTLGAEFLAAAQVIVYAGAIMVLFVFAIMVLIAARRGVPRGPRGPGGVEVIGRLLFTDYLFPFELTSVLLLAAMVGVLLLARHRA